MFLWCKPEQPVEQTFELLRIWNIVVVTWRIHSKSYAKHTRIIFDAFHRNIFTGHSSTKCMFYIQNLFLPCALSNKSKDTKNLWLANINASASVKCWSNFESEHNLRVKIKSTFCEIYLKRMPQNTFDDNSILAQSYYLSQYWHIALSPFGEQYIAFNSLRPGDAHMRR